MLSTSTTFTGTTKRKTASKLVPLPLPLRVRKTPTFLNIRTISSTTRPRKSQQVKNRHLDRSRRKRRAKRKKRRRNRVSRARTRETSNERASSLCRCCHPSSYFLVGKLFLSLSFLYFLTSDKSARFLKFCSGPCYWPLSTFNYLEYLLRFIDDPLSSTYVSNCSHYLMVIISFWSVSVWSEDFYETWLSNESPVKQNLHHKSF